MEETWIKINDFDYYVSNIGNVRHINNNNNRKLYLDKDGYCCVTLKKNKSSFSRKVHRLVATAFITNDENKPEIDHIDGNKTNNTISNLRWVTRIENANAYRKLHKNNSSGHNNIYYDNTRNKYYLQKSHNGKNNFYGRYNTLEEAIKAKIDLGI